MEVGAVMRDVLILAVAALGFGICHIFVDRGVDLIVQAKFHHFFK